MISNKKENSLENFLEVLGNSPLFRGIDCPAIQEILKAVNAKRVRKSAGEYIFHAGDKISSMGVVLSGSVLIVQEDVWGRRNIMNRVLAGDIFAEIFAAAGNSALNVGVVADGDCEIILLNVGLLLSLPQKEERGNAVIKNLISLLAKKTMALNDKITHISKRTTRDKLLSFLSSQAMKKGKLRFDISYNRQELADFLCVERAAMCVELSRLQRDGILKYHKNRFELFTLSDM